MNKEEIWAPVVIGGEFGQYEVSSFGNVRNCVTGKILRPRECRGYLYVNLYKNGEMKTCQIHRLVAQAFLFNPLQKPQVNHRNEIKTNNCLENLEWCTAKENLNYGTRNERIALTRGKKVICVETGEIYPSTREAERQTGINQGSICSCCLGKLYTAGKYHWCYVD